MRKMQSPNVIVVVTKILLLTIYNDRPSISGLPLTSRKKERKKWMTAKTKHNNYYDTISFFLYRITLANTHEHTHTHTHTHTRVCPATHNHSKHSHSRANDRVSSWKISIFMIFFLTSCCCSVAFCALYFDVPLFENIRLTWKITTANKWKRIHTKTKWNEKKFQKQKLTKHEKNTSTTTRNKGYARDWNLSIRARMHTRPVHWMMIAIEWSPFNVCFWVLLQKIFLPVCLLVERHCEQRTKTPSNAGRLWMKPAHTPSTDRPNCAHNAHSSWQRI